MMPVHLSMSLVPQYPSILVIVPVPNARINPRQRRGLEPGDPERRAQPRRLVFRRLAQPALERALEVVDLVAAGLRLRVVEALLGVVSLLLLLLLLFLRLGPLPVIVLGVVPHEPALVRPAQPVVVEIEVDVEVEVVRLIQVVMSPRQAARLVLWSDAAAAPEPEAEGGALVHDEDYGLELPELGYVFEEPLHIAFRLDASVEHPQMQSSVQAPRRTESESSSAPTDWFNLAQKPDHFQKPLHLQVRIEQYDVSTKIQVLDRPGKGDRLIPT